MPWLLTAAGIVVSALALIWFLPGTLPALAAGRRPAANPLSGSTGPTAATEPTGSPAPTASPTPAAAHKAAALPPLELRATTVSVPSGGFLSWALMDRRTGQIWGSDTMTEPTWSASMIKAWLGADFLRRVAASGVTPTTDQLNMIEIMIRDSDNDAAEQTYDLDGGTASIDRLISLCKLTDTTARDDWWSYTDISARDTVRMANCIADGTAAGPQWTSFVLQMMREVRGDGDFGIREAFPAAEQGDIAIKNGWLDYDDDSSWHVNCMAVTGTWALAVLQRFPDTGSNNIGFDQATMVCQDAAAQLKNPAYSG